MCKSKIHRARVTDAKLDYTGSITLDARLMEAASLLPYEMVLIHNVANAARWETYVIRGEAGSGVVCLNGPPARLFQPGDEIIVLSFQFCSEGEIAELAPRVVFVDPANRVVETRVDPSPLEPPAGG